MQPHFFALHSRMGLVHPPVGSTELNIGVEDAPDFILSSEFLQKYPGSVTSYVFPAPESDHYFETIAEHTRQAALVISENLLGEETQIVIGGDHSVTFASLLALQERVESSDVGYIQIDAHPDLNTIASSPSGNFHGMYLRAAVGEIGSESIDAVIQPKLLPSNIWYFGNLSFDDNPEERSFIAQNAVRVTAVNEYDQNKKSITAELKNFLSSHQHIHLSVDIDGLDKTVALATGIPCQDGFLLEAVLELLAIIKASTASVSLDLVEVNPQKAGAVQTIVAAQKILAAWVE